ncbi:MAG TPA: lysophospholipid acyltransferase family protein [Spirochaetota bacterium]|nr:lysophospholipid acyltransferase family protein [Spirochaetota bacterium]HOM38207.1 lysophospholipid acyltransferase family protein [Spirochaetota bacterium]HPQ48575.1 lysophospholipid acyltransferase family protein [Spirochaetota bacterium]
MIIIKILKVPFIVFWVALFILYSILMNIFISNKKSKIRKQLATTSFFCKVLNKLIGIKINVNGIENFKVFENGLIVANHLSYIDILVLISEVPSIFISSVEVEKTFLLGYIVKLGGAIFIERRSRKDIKKEIEKITKKLKDGFNVAFFPEGTTTNGDKIKGFKSSFFESAAESSVNILPVCIFYDKINNKDINESNRDKVFYYGNMKFFSHFFKLLFVKNIKIRVDFLEPIKDLKDRKELSQIAYEKVSYKYNLLKKLKLEKGKIDGQEIKSTFCLRA